MSAAQLEAHLKSGATHVCTCWSILRLDGVRYGFTDHDHMISFDGIDFMPQTGMTARALASTTGLSVNNTEAIGVLSASAISEDDIIAGRFDGAEVSTWLVQWDNIAARQVQFVGSIGEINRSGGAFQADLRGLTEDLNQPQGRSYLTTCSAVLGDGRCRMDLDDPAYTTTVPLVDSDQDQVLRFASVTDFNEGWFEGGSLEVLSGPAAGLTEIIKRDEMADGVRVITLWQQLRAAVSAGDEIRLTAGCDRRAETCRVKFSNLVNFQGFPHVPGDDWLIAVPRTQSAASGGARFSGSGA